MDKLPIYTLIHNQYQVFDRSGQLPFSVVFGLCRRSSQDTNDRPLVLDIRRSVFDVPYALTNNLLKLSADGVDVTDEVALGINESPQASKDDAFLTLSSPVGRKENWKTAIIVYKYQIVSNSQLASVLKPGIDYELRLASEDLGVKWYGYGDRDELMDNEGQPCRETEKPKLVGKPVAGRCRFATVPSLSRPPRLSTKLTRAVPEDDQTYHDHVVLLQISVMNAGENPVTVQTRGVQRYLVPWGPMEPEARLEGRPRIIDAILPAPIMNLQLIDKATGTVVRRPPKLGPSGPGGQANALPKLDNLVTIQPAQSLVRLVDISKQFNGLLDGTYNVHLEPKGMWWCDGSREEFEDEGEGRVPCRLWTWLKPNYRRI